jgi:hypothetical protein
LNDLRTPLWRRRHDVSLLCQAPTPSGRRPYRKLIDRQREDNVVDVKIQNGDAS